MHCRIFCSTLGFYSLEHVTTKLSLAIAKYHLGTKLFLVKSYCTRVLEFILLTVLFPVAIIVLNTQ